MQLYAYDLAGHLVLSYQAKKHTNYCCLECGEAVRLREGHIRQPHFYHLQGKSQCRQSGKSQIHFQTQLYLKTQIDEIRLEHRFSEIGRIADALWPSEKIVFEIQCSLMDREEMEARTAAYASLGHQVVWILHDRKFNQWRQSALENALLGCCHYYTNINEKGQGIIYEQWRHIEQGIKRKTLPPLSVDLTKPYRTPQLGFQGDLRSLPPNDPYLNKITLCKKTVRQENRKAYLAKVMNGIKMKLSNVYHNFLKKYCED